LTRGASTDFLIRLLSQPLLPTASHALGAEGERRTRERLPPCFDELVAISPIQILLHQQTEEYKNQNKNPAQLERVWRAITSKSDCAR
jgi:hypothetical protein